MLKTIAPFLFLSLAIAVSILTPITHAQLAIGALVDTNKQLDYNDNRITTSSSARVASTTSDERRNATTTNGRTASTSVSGQLTAQVHRSTVATFTQSLLAVADREGGLGAQIRIIAETQKNSEATTTEAIEKIASRSSLKTLFIGSDYKNLGILRSEMVATQNHIDQLNVILTNATDASIRTTLSAQISALALDQANIQSFVKTHEKSFSFFGWFVNLFVKTDVEN